jgi:hypothetical protein
MKTLLSDSSCQLAPPMNNALPMPKKSTAGKYGRLAIQ